MVELGRKMLTKTLPASPPCVRTLPNESLMTKVMFAAVPAVVLTTLRASAVSPAATPSQRAGKNLSSCEAAGLATPADTSTH